MKKNTELAFLRRCGIAVELNYREHSKEPCLINLAADPIFSGTLMYFIPPGKVQIGRDSFRARFSSKKLDIVLDGPLVKPRHWLVQKCCYFCLAVQLL